MYLLGHWYKRSTSATFAKSFSPDPRRLYSAACLRSASLPLNCTGFRCTTRSTSFHSAFGITWAVRHRCPDTQTTFSASLLWLEARLELKSPCCLLGLFEHTETNPTFFATRSSNRHSPYQPVQLACFGVVSLGVLASSAAGSCLELVGKAKVQQHVNNVEVRASQPPAAYSRVHITRFAPPSRPSRPPSSRLVFTTQEQRASTALIDSAQALPAPTSATLLAG